MCQICGHMIFIREENQEALSSRYSELLCRTNSSLTSLTLFTSFRAPAQRNHYFEIYTTLFYKKQFTLWYHEDKELLECEENSLTSHCIIQLCLHRIRSA